MAGGYIADAQQSAAKAEAEGIASAFSQMLNDVGEAWVVRDGNGTLATDPPLHTAANRVDLLVTDGTIPAVATARSVGGPPDWHTTVNLVTPNGVQKLEWFLVTNTPSNATANAYRTAANMSVVGQFDPDSGAQFNSEHAWRGSYLPGPIGADPWGRRYGVNVECLARALGAGPSGNVNDVIAVVSGGAR